MSDQILRELLSPGPPALAVIGFLLFACWCFQHRRVDQTLAALALYLGLLDGYVKLSTGSPFVTLARDVLVIAIALGVLLRTTASQQRLHLPPLGGFVLAFAAIVAVELFNPSAPGVRAGLAGARQHLEFVPLFFLGYAVMRSESRLRKLAIILVVCAAAGGVVSFIQSTLTPEELADWGPGYQQRIYGTGAFTGAGRVAFNDDGTIAVRPFGLGSDLGGGAFAAALALPALMAMLMWARGGLRLAILPMAVALALAVATSGSRAGIVIAFVSVTAFALLVATSRYASRLAVGLALAAVLIFAVFQQLGPSNSTAKRATTITPTRFVTTYKRERGSNVAKVGEYAVRYPLGLGVGSVGAAGFAFGNREQYEQLNTETLWNFLVLEVGIPGMAVFIILLLTVLALASTRIPRVKDLTLRLNLAAIAAPLFALLAASFAGPTTIGVPAGPFLWFAMGVLSYWLIRARVDLDPRRQAASTRPRNRRSPAGEPLDVGHAPEVVRV